MAEEEPLRHFALAHYALAGACRNLGGAEHAGRAHLSACRGGGNRSAGRHLIDHDGTNAGEIEAAQEGSDGNLAGAAQLHQKAHQRLMDLAEFAREFVHGRQLHGVVFARKKRGTRVAELAE